MRTDTQFLLILPPHTVDAGSALDSWGRGPTLPRLTIRRARSTLLFRDAGFVQRSAQVTAQSPRLEHRNAQLKLHPRLFGLSLLVELRRNSLNPQSPNLQYELGACLRHADGPANFQPCASFRDWTTEGVAHGMSYLKSIVHSVLHLCLGTHLD